MKYVWRYFLLACIIVLLDQAIKLTVHFTMEMGALGQIKLIGDWFKLYYILNPGMAFGIQFGFPYDKVWLTLIRIIATIMIVRHIWRLSKDQHVAPWILWGWALVLGGAASNGIDSIFYGVVLDNTPYQVPFSWFYGQVIDMFYLDIWSGRLPNWIPLLGGQYASCFPIFNLADVAIIAGIVLIIFSSNKKTQQSNPREPLDNLAQPS